MENRNGLWTPRPRTTRTAEQAAEAMVGDVPMRMDYARCGQGL